MKHSWRHLTALFAAAGALLAPACASIGRPDGGARDTEPPVFISSRPAPAATGVTSTRITAIFDENIQLDDAFNKVIVSPVQSQPPSVSANGRRLSVELRDTLIPDATYTIDFGDAIKDLNEGNILDGFALDFSTGPTIDSLRISGIVLAAENLEPAQGMLVGVYRADSVLPDSTVRTKALERVARTNQLGQFTVRGLAPGAYRIYAINDINRDYRWDRSEDAAFLDVDLTPAVEPIQVTDTLRGADGLDSIATRHGHRYLPNDVLLTWFNEGYRAQYLKDYTRPTRRIITLGFGATCDTLPRIAIVNDTTPGARRIDPRPDWLLPQVNLTRDTLQYWITDSAVYAVDSLRLAVSYRRPDSLEQLTWTTDTLRFFFRDPKPKDDKKKKKKEKTEDTDSLAADTLPPAPPIEFLAVRALGGTTQDVHLPLNLEFDQPLAAVDTAAIHLELLRDTTYTPVDPPRLIPDTLRLQRRSLAAAWTPGAKYRLTIDSAAITGIYGNFNKPFKHEFSVKPEEEYSGIDFNLQGLPPGAQAIVQLLTSADKPQYTQAATPDGHAVFRHLNPATYYARLFIDTNANGRWDTGILDSIQPEEVYYFPKALKLKKNWDIAQDWNINELPVDAQKPLAIKKNKPKLKPGEKRTDDDSEEEEDECGSSNFITPTGRGGFGAFGSGT
ncbi:MAG: Ig-like domain-containing protein, partial [Muribaculaceae bacterium]|nr:Ig-like domain-containing protein [Muribaculaceae bacterium]